MVLHLALFFLSQAVVSGYLADNLPVSDYMEPGGFTAVRTQQMGLSRSQRISIKLTPI